ncbi:MAG: hypothetical protein QXZ70_06595 [Candidatus Bathyarchaeia archaeon]
MNNLNSALKTKNITSQIESLLSSQTIDFYNSHNLLDQACSQIAQRFALYNHEGRPCKNIIIEVVANHSCLGCIIEKLSNRTTTNEVDALYKECHRQAVNFLVEELYFLLNQMGHKVAVSTEAELEYGKADILITVTNYGLNLKGQTKELLVEVKTGMSLSLSQLFRYLLDARSETIVVWRVRKRQVLVLKTSDIKPLLNEFIRMICLRSIRLLSSQQIQPCHHKKQFKYSPKQDELQEMFKDFSEAITETLPTILQTIIEELEIANLCRQENNHAPKKGVQ